MTRSDSAKATTLDWVVIGASREAGFGLYLGLIAAIAAVAASVLAFRAEGGNVSWTPSSIPPPTA